MDYGLGVRRKSLCRITITRGLVNAISDHLDFKYKKPTPVKETKR
jgi:hypothetical protein